MRDSDEGLDRKAAGSDQAAQGALGNFPMIRDRERHHKACLDQDHVTAALPHHLPAVPGKRLDHIAPAESRQGGALHRNLDLLRLNG